MKSLIKTLPLVAVALAALATTANAQIINEDFSGNSGIDPSTAPACVTHGVWTRVNNSSPVGTITPYYVPDGAATFLAQDGSVDQYCAANYSSGSGLATLQGWYISPQVPIVAGYSFSFWTRQYDTTFPDEMEVRLSTSGASSNVGTTATTFGTFTKVIAGYNVTTNPMPVVWTQSTYTITAADASAAGAFGGTGRFAFRYFSPAGNGGPSGAYSNYIGIDTIQYNVPEPTSLALLGLGCLAMIRRRK